MVPSWLAQLGTVSSVDGPHWRKGTTMFNLWKRIDAVGASTLAALLSMLAVVALLADAANHTK